MSLINGCIVYSLGPSNRCVLVTSSFARILIGKEKIATHFCFFVVDLFENFLGKACIDLCERAGTWSPSPPPLSFFLPILALAQWLGAILEVFQKLRGAVWVDVVNCPNSSNETICCSRRQSWQLNPIIKISLPYPQPHPRSPRPPP